MDLYIRSSTENHLGVGARKSDVFRSQFQDKNNGPSPGVAVCKRRLYTCEARLGININLCARPLMRLCSCILVFLCVGGW